MDLVVEVLVHRRCGAMLRVRCRPRHARGRAPGGNMGGAKLAFHGYRDCQAQAEEERLADDYSEDQGVVHDARPVGSHRRVGSAPGRARKIGDGGVRRRRGPDHWLNQHQESQAKLDDAP